MRCLLDTGAIFAFLVPRDRFHDAARRFMRQRGLRLFTTPFIVAEAFTAVRHRHGYEPAMTWVDAIEHTPLVTVVHGGSDFDARTWDTLRRLRGIPLSYADASLVVLAGELGIQRVFAFDSDFEQAGLQLVPGR